ncbi:hypothetical protein BLNAU_7772 [Blattamonas nauphoetae]|uniref:Uncharacterized protein n=1 Tax=Blattamonas nauphoetae TaxID=2049346 RepID=A0ABQ9Y0C0_9EUKA|nr:hypothetical protein BLNAU_7772 [Blattamonas nauphoetae]
MAKIRHLCLFWSHYKPFPYYGRILAHSSLIFDAIFLSGVPRPQIEETYLTPQYEEYLQEQSFLQRCMTSHLRTSGYSVVIGEDIAHVNRMVKTLLILTPQHIHTSRLAIKTVQSVSPSHVERKLNHYSSETMSGVSFGAFSQTINATRSAELPGGSPTLHQIYSINSAAKVPETDTQTLFQPPPSLIIPTKTDTSLHSSPSSSTVPPAPTERRRTTFQQNPAKIALSQFQDIYVGSFSSLGVFGMNSNTMRSIRQEQKEILKQQKPLRPKHRTTSVAFLSSPLVQQEICDNDESTPTMPNQNSLPSPATPDTNTDKEDINEKLLTRSSFTLKRLERRRQSRDEKEDAQKQRSNRKSEPNSPVQSQTVQLGWTESEGEVQLVVGRTTTTDTQPRWHRPHKVSKRFEDLERGNDMKHNPHKLRERRMFGISESTPNFTDPLTSHSDYQLHLDEVDVVSSTVNTPLLSRNRWREVLPTLDVGRRRAVFETPDRREGISGIHTPVLSHNFSEPYLEQYNKDTSPSLRTIDPSQPMLGMASLRSSASVNRLTSAKSLSTLTPQSLTEVEEEMEMVQERDSLVYSGYTPGLTVQGVVGTDLSPLVVHHSPHPITVINLKSRTVHTTFSKPGTSSSTPTSHSAFLSFVKQYDSYAANQMNMSETAKQQTEKQLTLKMEKMSLTDDDDHPTPNTDTFGLVDVKFTLLPSKSPTPPVRSSPVSPTPSFGGSAAATPTPTLTTFTLKPLSSPQSYLEFAGLDSPVKPIPSLASFKEFDSTLRGFDSKAVPIPRELSSYLVPREAASPLIFHLFSDITRLDRSSNSILGERVKRLHFRAIFFILFMLKTRGIPLIATKFLQHSNYLSPDLLSDTLFAQLDPENPLTPTQDQQTLTPAERETVLKVVEQALNYLMLNEQYMYDDLGVLSGIGGLFIPHSEKTIQLYSGSGAQFTQFLIHLF